MLDLNLFQNEYKRVFCVIQGFDSILSYVKKIACRNLTKITNGEFCFEWDFVRHILVSDWITNTFLMFVLPQLEEDIVHLDTSKKKKKKIDYRL